MRLAKQKPDHPGQGRAAGERKSANIPFGSKPSAAAFGISDPRYSLTATFVKRLSVTCSRPTESNDLADVPSRQSRTDNAALN
jgi:hypothetical protein